MNTIGWRDLLIASYEPKKDRNGYKYLVLEVLILSERERGQTRKVELTNGPVSQQLLESALQGWDFISLGPIEEVDLWDISYLLFERKLQGLLDMAGHFREYRRYDE